MYVKDATWIIAAFFYKCPRREWKGVIGKMFGYRCNCKIVSVLKKQPIRYIIDSDKDNTIVLDVPRNFKNSLMISK